MHLINLLIVSGLIALVIAGIAYARRRRDEDRERAARLKRFNMSSDELQGTRFDEDLHGSRIYVVPESIKPTLSKRGREKLAADLDE